MNATRTWSQLGPKSSFSQKTYSKRRERIRKRLIRLLGPLPLHVISQQHRGVITNAFSDSVIHDVGCDMHKAQVKLKKIKERLQGVRDQAAAQIEQLTAAEHKLSVAIVAALLITCKQVEG